LRRSRANERTNKCLCLLQNANTIDNLDNIFGNYFPKHCQFPLPGPWQVAQSLFAVATKEFCSYEFIYYLFLSEEEKTVYTATSYNSCLRARVTESSIVNNNASLSRRLVRSLFRVIIINHANLARLSLKRTNAATFGRNVRRIFIDSRIVQDPVMRTVIAR